MEIALIVIGLLLVAVALMWVYAHLDNPTEIDMEEEVQVRHETPEERERARIESAVSDMQSNAQDIEMYSPGDSADTSSQSTDE